MADDILQNLLLIQCTRLSLIAYRNLAYSNKWFLMTLLLKFYAVPTVGYSFRYDTFKIVSQ